MGRRRPSIPPGQFAFTFDVPRRACGASALTGLDREIAATVATMLKEDPRSRYQIAAAVSELLDDDVTKQMLDAYASEAKETHMVSFARMLALTSATDRYDLLDRLMRRIGAALLVGEEIVTAELGQIDRQIEELKKRRRTIATTAPVIVRGNGG